MSFGAKPGNKRAGLEQPQQADDVDVLLGAPKRGRCVVVFFDLSKAGDAAIGGWLTDSRRGMRSEWTPPITHTHTYNTSDVGYKSPDG